MVEFLISPTEIYEYSMESAVNQKPVESCEIETVYSAV